MIALSRKTAKMHIVMTFPEADGANLFDYAKQGDTMHMIPDVPHTSGELLQRVNEQLQQGKYKEIRL